MDALDRTLINALQGDFPISERPFAEVAARFGCDEATVIERIRRLIAAGFLSRFGPLYNAEAMGGALCLAAMAVPAERFDEVAAQVNRHPEVAHNYARDHRLNMWFVIATETAAALAEVVRRIEGETGLSVHLLPRVREYFVGLKLTV
jgi:DNA-binding Lrp family transcriptional regulator